MYNTTMQKVLSLDVSSKTGYSVQNISKDGCILLDYGLLGPYPKPEGNYPNDYYHWANICASNIIKKIYEINPTVIVVEQVSKGSKNHLSQLLLDWIHYLLAHFFIDQGIQPIYYQTGFWRSAIGIKLTKEEKKKNALIRKTRKATGAAVVKDLNGKRIGLTGKKHANVRVANELYGLSLKLKDEDKADAICLGRCFYEVTHNGYVSKNKE